MIDNLVWLYLIENPGCTPEELRALAQTCCIANDAQTYQYTVTTSATAPIAVRLDGTALPGRLAILIRNVGANLVEYALNAPGFKFGQGDQIAANGGYVVLTITPDVQIWVQCAPGNTTDLRCTELGEQAA